jgi:hypothetical protein
VAPRAKSTALALPKIDTEEKSVEFRLKLKGKVAVDLADYKRAYEEANGAIELEQLATHILATFMDADRGFQAWRRGAKPAPASN